MSDYNDVNNIIGMTDILIDDDEDIDIDSIEKSITQGIQMSKNEKDPIDFANEFSRDVELLNKQFGVTNNINIANEPNLEDNDEIDKLLNWSFDDKASNEKPNNSSYVMEEDNNDNDDDDNNDDSNNSYQIRPDPITSSRTNYSGSWSSDRPRDSQLSRMTNEERKQTHINDVLGNMNDSDNDNVFIEQEDEEDELARILEQIDLLRTNLEAEGVNLDRIPEVDANTPKKEIKGVLKILQIKNDRLRYCDMFEEGILACAYGLESIFDGKREIFGSKIDLVGYSDTVKVKLRRMRYDTSSFVSGVVKGYSIGHGWRIVFELLPSLFLYSRDRRNRTSDNLANDSVYKAAINDLNN